MFLGIISFPHKKSEIAAVMDSNVEKDCSLLEDLFQQVVNDMKNSFPAWEDFILKSGRLHSALKTVAVCMTSFLEAFQRVADMATGTRGSTREIGSALTRLCLRHRSIENKLKGLNNALTDAMIIPLQERMEEWKRSVVALDRDHAKESKRAHQDLKRSSLEAVRQQKKLKKGKIETSEQLDRAVQDVNDKLLLLREFEKTSVKASLIEERSRLCLFISCLKPVMDEEMAMLTEVTHLQEIVHSLCMVADDPESLSSSSEQVVSDLIGTKSQSSLPTIAPGSPSSEGSLTSSAGSLSHSPTHHSAYNRSQSQPNPATGALSFSLPKDVTSSISSQDSMAPPSYSSVLAGDMLSTSTALNTSGDHFKLPESGGALPAYDSGSRQMRGAKLMRAKDTTYSAPFERPHTISTAYERSASRPVLTSETYMAPELCHHPQLQSHQHRPQSTYIGGSSSSTGNDNPYAVPCLVPKRRQVQSGEVKVADIYARPSLVSGTGYRTPNIRPLPVATPTVPDFGTGQQPAFPVAGYVNMNQLAHMALQHQQELSQKKEQQESSDEKTDDDEVTLKYSSSSAEQRKPSRGLRPYASAESDPDADADRHRPTYGTWGSSHAKEPASAPVRDSMDPGLTLSGSGIDLHALADRLARACHLESIDNFCTLRYRKPPSGHYLSSSTAGISALYSGKSLGKEPITSRVASMPRGFSLTDMPPVAASPLQLYVPEMGTESRPSRYAQGTECWSPDQESPVMK